MDACGVASAFRKRDQASRGQRGKSHLSRPSLGCDRQAFAMAAAVVRVCGIDNGDGDYGCNVCTQMDYMHNRIERCADSFISPGAWRCAAPPRCASISVGARLAAAQPRASCRGAARAARRAARFGRAPARCHAATLRGADPACARLCFAQATLHGW